MYSRRLVEVGVINLNSMTYHCILIIVGIGKRILSGYGLLQHIKHIISPNKFHEILYYSYLLL